MPPIKHPINKNEILAIIQANRALGSDYDEHTADQIYELFQKTAGTRELTPEALTQYLQQLPANERKKLLRPFVKRKHSLLGNVSAIMALSIPLLLIAGLIAHNLGIFAVLGFDALVIILMVGLD
ncbi:hypothetical protein [Sulfobacillus thermosulfidooxidans]|uniref:hypothetical protein n=1 Tax=Sulfobacillus thermosulfidooxidans TaxID=28034 RepID=UPI00096B7E10|nr:hypothetical protein [Sulfobacillus thermosulfidooxidans]OLZ08996.1 hypothetical protein BFX05_02000 [Sulfobacillus thermosulfidooxidans]OLZ14182.1 hypothetical protein BFX06_07770 [Sulfobacillus thermosulfidooxidans]OLZ18925.1 hypothetical protein BFX07_04165 [Sulfobacillus thermosulfidooxidans]